MNLLSVKDLSKQYEGQKKSAIHAVSFSMNKGEIIAIVGENGSGKTTLLKLINGILDADQGEIYFKDEKIKGPAHNLVPGHKHIKMLFQQLNLFPKHTIKENILYNIRMLSDEEQESILKELIHLCRLEGLENKIPSELSGGQQQRVALAKAIADKPQLLLMDEPFSNLDLFLKDEIKQKVIHKIKEEGNSALFVTHDLQDALSLGDKIMVMKDGEIMQLDTPQMVYEKPANEYVAYLFGNVNIIKAPDLIKEFKVEKSSIISGEIKKACIRPENFVITSKEKSVTSGTVDHIAYLGDSYELLVKTKNLTIRVNTRKKKINKGERIYLKLTKSKIHFIG